MDVIGFNNVVYKLNLSKFIVHGNGNRHRSQYHVLARHILRDMYKGYSILEEVKLPGSRGPATKSVLFLDFFIEPLRVAFEIHGKQHYEYSQFFHKTKLGFIHAQQRDRIKSDWCRLNSIDLIILKYSDNPEQWRQQIERYRANPHAPGVEEVS